MRLETALASVGQFADSEYSARLVVRIRGIFKKLQPSR